jgi:NAD(P)-dependent dehydrogenase (short-subunit alcohol dehydrogenase family)
MGRLDGKVAIVTGGASGMGRATVKRFVEEGARVVIGDVQGEPGAAFARELGDAARFKLTDVAREADVAALVAYAIDQFGQLDCMFNNAGFGGIAGNLIDLELADAYRNTVDVLFTGVIAGTKHAARAMQARGGSIINTASVAGLRAGYGPHVYSAMKAAVLSLSRSAAVELGAHGIRVNAICPGFIATPIFAGARNWSHETRQRFAAELEKFPATATPIRRAGLGADIAALALYLASDESTFVTGQQFVVDGGLMAGNPPDPTRPSGIQDLADRIEAEPL